VAARGRRWRREAEGGGGRPKVAAGGRKWQAGGFGLPSRGRLLRAAAACVLHVPTWMDPSRRGSTHIRDARSNGSCAQKEQRVRNSTWSSARTQLVQKSERTRGKVSSNTLSRGRSAPADACRPARAASSAVGLFSLLIDLLHRQVFHRMRETRRRSSSEVGSLLLSVKQPGISKRVSIRRDT